MMTNIPWPAVLLALALLQWIVVVVATFFAKPKVQDRLVISTVVLAVAYGIVFHAETIMPKSRAKIAAASAVSAQQPAGTCAMVNVGMRADLVEEKLGKPNEVRDDAKTRGPGAVTWIYRDSRCALHFIDERVEIIE